MEDETRLIDGAKGSLYDSLLNQIDDKFHLTSFIPPKQLIPYLKGTRPETNEEAQDCRRLYERWIEDTLRALKRRPSSENLQEFLEVLPEPFRANVIRTLRESIIKS